MTDVYGSFEVSADIKNIERHFEKIKLSQSKSTDIVGQLSSATEEFKKFFASYNKPSFKAVHFTRNSSPASVQYNENIETLKADIDQLYTKVAKANSSTVNSFNYATIVSQEITSRAQSNISKVIDLSILNKLNRGQVIVGGDDFIDLSKVDQSSSVYFIKEANLATLSIESSENVTHPGVKVSILPLKPVGPDGKISTDPTPFNLERFYEGKYYAYIGEQEPEGGQLKLTYGVKESKIEPIAVTTTRNGQRVESSSGTPSTEEAKQSQKNANFFAAISATEEEKAANRAKMFDGNPDTYWQAEYVFKTEPLIDPFESGVDDNENSNLEDAGNFTLSEGTQIVIDLKTAENIAKKYDYAGRDLSVAIEIDLGVRTPLNYVLINPVIAGTSSFIKVIDISTADDRTDFKTVEGFNSQSFDKVLTPEANKVLSKEVQEKLLAPSAFSYSGIGVFSFPVRMASKVRITLLVEDPVPAPYERMHVLLQELVYRDTKIVVKKSGIF